MQRLLDGGQLPSGKAEVVRRVRLCRGALRQRKMLNIRVRSLGNYDSAAEDETLTKEFEQFKGKSDPQGAMKVAAHLNLLWSISERRRPELCECCHGSGERECVWCHGTGAMTVGDTLYCSESGCSKCPVCNGLGTCKCEHCRGTGKRAVWAPGTKSPL